jgi:hypothetical protein
MDDRLGERGQLPEGTGGDIDWMQRWRDAGGDFDWEDEPARQQSGPFSLFDSLGRKIPRRLGIADYLLTIARSEPARVRRVPSQAVVEEGEDEHGSFSFVTCPCGARPVVRQRLEKCDGCARNYVRFEGGAVFVAYGDGGAPPLSIRAGS